MKPLIGITSFEEIREKGPYATVNDAYSRSVLRAGGIPVMIPTVRDIEEATEYAKKIDGLILTGGNEDISPVYYAGTFTKTVGYINPPRDTWEMALVKAVEAANKPVLGICRGHQLINVSRGGSLYGNVHEEYEQAQGHWAGKTDMRYAVHNIIIEEGSKLHEIFGVTKAGVNSYHNQGIKEVGNGLRVMAVGDDDLIEAICDDDKKFVVGVQWHPEAMTEDDVLMQKLFSAFVKAAE